MKRRAAGFTLMEILFAMVIFAVAAVGMSRFFMGTQQLGEASRNLTRAMEDARMVTEAIRDNSAAGLAAVTGVNWAQWAVQNGLTTLPNQAVTVTYADQNADPLSVTIQVSWLDRNHARTATMRTLVTQR
ncbi:MAG: prepilin-type N-terminal cleavage/methylation domain-containing protein [Candidatus Omnitrophica bacterium]|nr:prepilin-type N-terminal cleavage/methylation domain-containing protein [Candidatus Omnitrophota bacterium]